MLGIVILLLASFVILKLGKTEFTTMGLLPNLSRLKDLVWGFVAAAGICTIYFILIIRVLNYNVEINTAYTAREFLYGSWWTLRSVLIEELLFRGALLILALKYLGKHKACLLSAVIFGIYHWFSYSVFGNLLPMLFTFIITGVGGLMFAYAFTETRSLYLPIGLHLGWNLLTITIFSEGPLGDQFLITSGGEPMGSLYFVFLLYQILLLPAFTIFYLRTKSFQSFTG